MELMRENCNGICDRCGKVFPYYLVHCGFSECSYAYCDLCGRTALLSSWHPAWHEEGISELEQRARHQEIPPELEPYLLPCACGGKFKHGARPRCPECKQALSAGRAADYIERNAPGAKKGWRWQGDWHGLHCIVVADNIVEDNFKPRRGFPSRAALDLEGMSRRFVPPDATIAELEKKAADCEQKAAKAEEPLAAELRQEAKLYRGWIAALRSGRWTS